MMKGRKADDYCNLLVDYKLQGAYQDIKELADHQNYQQMGTSKNAKCGTVLSSSTAAVTIDDLKNYYNIHAFDHAAAKNGEGSCAIVDHHDQYGGRTKNLTIAYNSTGYEVPDTDCC